MAPPEDENGKHDIKNTDKNLSETVRVGNLSDVPILSGFNVPAVERPSTNGHNPHHRRARSLHLPHLLNNDHFTSVSAAKDAGEEEFGGVAPVRIVFDRNNEEHRRFLSSGRIDSSGSGLATMIKELSFIDLCIEGKSSSSSLKRSSSASLDEGDSSSARGVSSSSPRISPQVPQQTVHEKTPLVSGNEYSCNGFDEHGNESLASKEELKAIHKQDFTPLTETLIRVGAKVFQPPVIGALTGLLIASFPNLRGILVNIWAGSDEPAPLQWMFDGIYAVGNAAVPINMCILGINLSSTFQKKKSEGDGQSKMLSNQTMFAVTIGKMLVMPLIGIVSTWFLQQYFIDFPDGKLLTRSLSLPARTNIHILTFYYCLTLPEIDGTCYLVSALCSHGCLQFFFISTANSPTLSSKVMMIVFITPTANNVMVMVELSGSSSKEGMARLIGYQYLVAPVILR